MKSSGGFQPSGFIYSEDQHSDMGISTSQKMIGKSAPTSRPDLAVTKKKTQRHPSEPPNCSHRQAVQPLVNKSST